MKVHKRIIRVIFVGGVMIGVLGILGYWGCTSVHAQRCDAAIQNERETVSEQLSPRYFTYSSLLQQQAFSQQKNVVLYFYAPWCSTCASLDEVIAQQPDSIPEHTIVLRIPFDEPSALKVRYGITLPHTFVWIYPDGEVRDQWIGGDLEELRQRVAI